VVHPDRLAVLDGERRWSYKELEERCRRLAGALAGRVDGRPVAVLSPNSHALLEAHYGVPWSGSPLVALNSRLSSGELAWILGHSEAALLVYDDSLSETAHAAAREADGVDLLRVGGDNDEYEELIDSGSPLMTPVTDERGLLSINYTSGTTGNPKGVMYHHRGAYLQALAMVVHAGLTSRDVYLWTLPMFHCNGWCFTWAVTAAGATHICARRVEAAEIWKQIENEGVTALCGAPTVLTMIGHAPEARPLEEGRRLRILTGGSPPTPAILGRMDELGADVTHLYGLTETYGPAVVCDWQAGWDDLDAEAKARLRARQGVGNVIANPVRVVDEDGGDVAADGETTGEIAVRGNDVMLGYLHDDDATATSIPDGWFRTGDIGVMHPDHYIELRDRSKDVIISGGENISSVEVEAALSSHPAVLECAVIAVPDERWGEVPGAYVTLKEDASASAEELIDFVKDHLARFKAPKHVNFGPLPKTSTGKVQKFELREKAWADHDRHIG
jgi:fatty-acyl-CoA synthase